jgi:hypothetical protein
MKAKLMSSFLASLFLVAMAVALAPRPAMALGDELGKFTLPVEVHWGVVVLEPGNYTISSDNVTSSSMICVHKDGSPTVGYFIPSLERESIPSFSQKTQLVLDQKEGKLYVKELLLEGDGLGLYYGEPKSKK